jgi:hypothetical protein
MRNLVKTDLSLALPNLQEKLKSKGAGLFK